MTDEVTKGTTQPEPSKKMKIAKTVTTVGVNLIVTVLVGVVAEQVTKQVNQKFFPDPS